ncbi:MAG TPA: helix-turn-helix domain-containing protein [Solirubrobacteraceae bacterium]
MAEKHTPSPRTVENRPLVTDPKVLEALAHPVRLDLLSYLMSDGPATASVCARAVGDTPSNSSYHLRALAKHGLVEPVSSADGRQRPWRATVTGFRTAEAGLEPDTAEAQGTAELLAASVALDQRLLRDYLSHRDEVAVQWQEADQYAGYTLRVSPEELRELGERLDALIRPLIAATRKQPPEGAELVHLTLFAFPRTGSPWSPRQP